MCERKVYGRHLCSLTLVSSPDDTVGDLKKLIAAQTGTRADKIVLKKWYGVMYKVMQSSLIVSHQPLPFLMWQVGSHYSLGQFIVQ